MAGVMNYRHAYHAGNFADVLKHVVLTLVLTYMKQKPQPFRVIDTHAGAGRYDLGGQEAAKTGEWRDGIGRLLGAELAPDVAKLLAPYLDAVRALGSGEPIASYPGSPLLARHLMRPADVLIANELHPEDVRTLGRVLGGDGASKVLQLDAYTALKSLLPPKERRGVVLVDPPFEDRSEFERLTAALDDALRRFATGVYIVWYPVKNQASAASFAAQYLQRERLDALDARLAISQPEPGLGLTESGVLVVNPPYTLQHDLGVLLPALSTILADGKGSGFRIAGSAP